MHKRISIGPVDIPQGQIVKVKETGPITKITAMERQNNRPTNTRIDKDHYRVERTGEVKEYNHIDNRSESTESISKSMSKLRDIINTNVVNPLKCRWVTLTYKDNMQEANKLRYDFGHFIKNVRNEYGPCEYIAVAEPQGRGAWHLHIILIFQDNAPYMDNTLVREKLWKDKGFVSIKKLTNIDNVGAYLTAYLSDVELSEYQALNPAGEYIGEIKVVYDADNKTEKRYVKGARLSMYPPKFHLFRVSKRVKRPVEYSCQYGQVKCKLDNAALTYSYIEDIHDPVTGYENRIACEFYNRKRKKKHEEI